VSARAPLPRGDIVLVQFPYTDLTGLKLRPALVVAPQRDADVILAFITSQIGGTDPQTDHLIAPTHAEFGRTGLKVASVIRLDKIATLHRTLVYRRLGSIGPSSTAAVGDLLRRVFEL